MQKVKVSKKLIALILTGTITTGVTITTLDSMKKDNKRVENSNGYENINPIFNLNMDEKDFIVLNVGSHDSIGVHFQNRKIKYCNEKDMSLGIVITPKEHTESGIYNDVEYTKGLISKYKIDYPVYLDIDCIIEDDDLNLEMKEKLIKDFLEKCEANGIYVGIYGTDTNLCRTKKYCNVNSNDAFVIKDTKNIKYRGNYTVYKELNDKIISIKNMSEVIKNNKLNIDSNFKSDGAYTVKEDDDITDIAMKYGMSTSELLEFNDIDKKDLKPGKILRIPMRIGNIKTTKTGEYRKVETPLRGCDISYAQEKNSNWEELKDNFDFIILRSNNGLLKDEEFEYNISNCASNNIPVGVYCYNGFDIDNSNDFKSFKKSQNAQVEYTISQLKNKNITYPVYIDIEYNDDIELQKKLPKEYINYTLTNWSNKIRQAGFIPGLYCNLKTYEYINKVTDYNISDKLELWLAGGEQYGDEFQEDIEFKYVVPSKLLEDDYNATIVQSTNIAVNAGSKDRRNHLDIDFSKIDYTKEITKSEEEKTNFKIKEFNRIDYQLLLGSILSISTVTLTGARVLQVKRRKKRRFRNKVKTKKR